MDRKNKQSTLNEVRILCSVDNEFVVGYMDAFLEKNGTELCIGTCLYTYILIISHGICWRRRFIRSN